MATSTGTATPIAVELDFQLDHDDEELRDEKIEALIAADDIEGARAEFELPMSRKHSDRANPCHNDFRKVGGLEA